MQQNLQVKKLSSWWAKVSAQLPEFLEGWTFRYFGKRQTSETRTSKLRKRSRTLHNLLYSNILYLLQWISLQEPNELTVLMLKDSTVPVSLCVFVRGSLSSNYVSTCIFMSYVIYHNTTILSKNPKFPQIYDNSGHKASGFGKFIQKTRQNNTQNIRNGSPHFWTGLSQPYKETMIRINHITKHSSQCY